MTRLGLRLSTLLLGLTVATQAFAQEDTKKSDADATAKPAAPATATHTVKVERFKIEVDLSGVFEADQMSPVDLRPKSWSSFTVLNAVPHGKKVEKGETLVWLDMEKIDEQLQDLEQARRLSKLSQQLADTELDLLKATVPMDLEAAARTQKLADEDLNYFLKVNRSFLEESAEVSLQNSKDSLEYAEEELKQLEKMYNADDLTEETEEIVLKRARNDVERSKFYLKSTELRTKKTLEQDIARQEQQLVEAAKRAEIAAEKAKLTLPVQLEKQQTDRQKQLLENERSEQKFKELMEDRKMMAVPAPADGYVYYGRCTRGKWGGIDSVASQLQEGGKLTPNSVFMTIVSPRPLHIRADVAEKDLHRIQRGISGKAVPTGYPDLELPAAVQYVSPFPIGPGVFDGHLRVMLDDNAKPVVPGMACKVTLVAYDKEAIAIPAAAVFDDEVSGQRNVVYLKTGDGQSEKRAVVIGQKTEQKWEIVQGLKPGDEILLKKPDAS